MKSKTVISLTNGSRLIFCKLPPNSSNVVENFISGMFYFLCLSVYFGKLLGKLWEEIGHFIEEIGYLEKSVAD